MGHSGNAALGALVLVTFLVGVSTHATGTPPRSTLLTLNAAAANEQQPQPEAESVLGMDEEGWGLRENGVSAADPSVSEQADAAALVGDTGSTAASSTEQDMEVEMENNTKNEKEKGEAEPKPNVFFIFIDDMGWNDIGYQSVDMQAVTPTLNRIAQSGIKLPQYYSQSLCTPARAALLTGRYPIRYGFQYSLIFPGAPWGLPLEEKLLPEYLKDHGYTCHMAGKWHLGGHTFDHLPHRRGFETSLSYTYGAETYWAHQLLPHVVPRNESNNDLDDTYIDIGFGNGTSYYHVARSSSPSSAPQAAKGDCMDDGPVGMKTAPAKASASSAFSFSAESSSSSPPSSSFSSTAERKGWYSTDMFATRTLEILKDKTPFDEKPLFMYLAHQAVHAPLGPPPTGSFSAEEMSVLDALDQDESSVRLRFAKVLMYLDKSIGQLIDYLEDEGWMENSIVVVASDNGGCPSDGGSNFPLRGVKMSNWEGGTKVPAFVYSRSHLPEELWGTEYNGLVHVTDWLPTLAAAAGIELSGSRGDLDGINHWDHIIGSSPSFPRDDGDGDNDCDDGGTGGVGNHDGDGGGGDNRDVYIDLEDLNMSSISSSANNSVYGPRNEILYNYDPYFLGADADRKPSDPDYAQAQGAFRRGKWKFLFKECCLGNYALNWNASVVEEDAADEETPGPGPYCYGCTGTCVDKVDCQDWLFDLEQDPSEVHNLASTYPEVVQDLRDRVSSVVNQEYSESLYVGADPSAFLAWKNGHNAWVVPWLEEGS